MSNTRSILLIWKKVYRNWKYSLSLIVIATIFYFVNVLIQNRNYQIVGDFYASHGLSKTLGIFFALSIGLKETILLSSFITLIITGLLVGMLFTLLFYKTRALKNHTTIGRKKAGLLTSVGIFLGVAAPGCAACGFGILALFGISATFLAALPLHGLEVSIIAIVILGITINLLSKGMIECKSCQIELNETK